MSGVQRTHKLTNQMNNIRNIWLCSNEINKTTNQLSIKCLSERGIPSVARILALHSRRLLVILLLVNPATESNQKHIWLGKNNNHMRPM